MMTTRCLIAVFVWALAVGSGSTGRAATVDFETTPPGTAYGREFGHHLGETVLVQDGIAMSLAEYFLQTFVGFNKAEVGGKYDNWFATTPLELNNIGVVFDFADVGYSVNEVSLEFLQFGGSSNFSVNGYAYVKLPTTGAGSWDLAPGVQGHLSGDVLTMQGPINYFQIGGQELALDNVVAIPEPAVAVLLGLSCGWLLRRRHNRSHAMP